MQFKVTTQGYTFVQEMEGDNIKAYDTVGDISGLEPVFISTESAKTQKDFEIEISYILIDHLAASN
jgi:hypothetical protein